MIRQIEEGDTKGGKKVMVSRKTLRDARIAREHDIAREINCWECQHYSREEKYCRKWMDYNPTPRQDCKHYFRYR